jgi:hypothetical protein
LKAIEIADWRHPAVGLSGHDFVQRLVQIPDARLLVDVIGRSAGVRAKRALLADGSCVAGAAPACDWTYTLTPGAYPAYDRKLVLRSPLGHETVHWFAENDAVWNYGLPMKSTTDGAGRFLSRQIYQGAEGTGLKRSTYLRYETDNSQYSQYNRNSRVASQRTTFHDDAGHWARRLLIGMALDTIVRATPLGILIRQRAFGMGELQGLPTGPTWFLGAFWDPKDRGRECAA